MKSLYIALAAATLFSACGPTLNAEQRANRAANNAIWETRQTYDIDGVKLQIAIAPDREYALIWPASIGQQITIGQVERSVDRVSGCDSTFDGLLLMIARGDRNAPVPFNKMRGSNSLRVDLQC